MTDQSDKCHRCYVSGRVQGVFFRAAAQTRAQQLGLVGFARNMQDGRVEVCVCGPDAQLDAFKKWLWQGPSEASVTVVDCESAAGERFEEFEVR